MKFMNDYDIERAATQYAGHSVLGPATVTLDALRIWADEHSDGWHSWPKPARAARLLMELIENQQAADRSSRQSDRDLLTMTAADLRRALAPVKGVRGRHPGRRLPAEDVHADQLGHRRQGLGHPRDRAGAAEGQLSQQAPGAREYLPGLWC